MPEAGTLYVLQVVAADPQGNESAPKNTNEAYSKGFTLEGAVVDAVRNSAGEHVRYKDIDEILQSGTPLLFNMDDDGNLTLEARFADGNKDNGRYLRVRGPDFIEVRVPYEGAVPTDVNDLGDIPTWSDEAPHAETMDVYDGRAVAFHYPSLTPTGESVLIPYVWGGGQDPEVPTVYVNLGARNDDFGYEDFSRAAEIVKEIGDGLTYLELVNRGVNTEDIPVESRQDEFDVRDNWEDATEHYGYPDKNVMIMASQYSSFPSNGWNIQTRKGFGKARIHSSQRAQKWGEILDLASQMGDSHVNTADGYWNDTHAANKESFPDDLLDRLQDGPISSVVYQLPDGSTRTLSKEALNLNLVIPLYNHTGLNEMSQDDYANMSPRPTIELGYNGSTPFIVLPAPKKF